MKIRNCLILTKPESSLMMSADEAENDFTGNVVVSEKEFKRRMATEAETLFKTLMKTATEMKEG